MGAEVSSQSYSREERQRYREKVRQNLDVFEKMLNTSSFEFDRPMTGLEIELNLVDADMQPHFHNAEVLAAIADEDYQTELAQYNIELNVPPRPLPGDSALELERTCGRASTGPRPRPRRSARRSSPSASCRRSCPSTTRASGSAATTATPPSTTRSSSPAARTSTSTSRAPPGSGSPRTADSIAPESACTSVQLHLQVTPSDFAAHWNAAQALCAPQVALAANSPFFFGKRLHAETRIELFKQATDTRPIELKNQGVRPRVFFGERWITSIFDLFEENVRYFPTLLAETTDEDPMAKLEAGEAPELAELRLHNGTVYRWNRPIYDIPGGVPHLRVENRVLPAGPTIVDVLANAAFYYGAIRMLAHEDRPVWTKMSFAAARRTSTGPPVTASTRTCTGPGSVSSRPTS
jgi:hypothetical protein